MILAFSLDEMREQIQNPLVMFGMFGQLVFMFRFIVQWYVSERRGESHIPIAFWYLSIAGALMLLSYAWMRKDLVFTFAQSLGLLIYVRNLMLIRKHKLRMRRAAAGVELPAGS